MKKIIILDASTSEVHIYNIPNGKTKTTEDIEDWITSNTQHRLSESSWMLLPLTFQFSIH
jgi:hypothetical protein